MKLNGLKFALGTLLPCILASSPSLAADPIDEAAPYSWSGLYLGAHGGYAWGRGRSGGLVLRRSDSGQLHGRGSRKASSLVFPELGLPIRIPAHSSVACISAIITNSMAALFSARSRIWTLGRNLRALSFIGENFGYSPEEAISDDTSGEIKLRLSGSARVRAGYAVDRWLPFVTGGVAFAKYTATINAAEQPLEYPRSGKGNLVGWTLGGGVNYALTDHVILGAEYRFTNFGKDWWD